MAKTNGTKAKIGRPTKYKPEMCERVVELGKIGVGRAGIAAALDVTRVTVATWEATHPEFLYATTRARDLSLAWWEKQGREGIWSRDFNAPAYRLQVMNRFRSDWSDRQLLEHTGADGGPMEVTTVDELRDAFAGRITGLASRIGTAGAHRGANGNGTPGV